jgi:tetraacyldisaccharide 4'-kinase
MKQKYPDVTIAVDKKRTNGIRQLMASNLPPDVILLDDAFQHRYVKPGLNILLVDYHRLIIYDKLLPAGRLREPCKEKNRADIVIVTKCPKEMKPMEYRVITKAMGLYAYQKLFFTTLAYGDLQPIYNKKGTRAIEDLKANEHVLLLTGIASPRQIEEDLKSTCQAQLSMLNFPDHHNFKSKDIQLINDTFEALPSPKCIITTEKDAARIVHINGLSKEVKANIYTLPVKIQFMLDQEQKFNEKIINYVRKNSRNGILAESKNDHKPQDSDSAGNRPRTISFRNN